MRRDPQKFTRESVLRLNFFYKLDFMIDFINDVMNWAAEYKPKKATDKHEQLLKLLNKIELAIAIEEKRKQAGRDHKIPTLYLVQAGVFQKIWGDCLDQETKIRTATPRESSQEQITAESLQIERMWRTQVMPLCLDFHELYEAAYHVAISYSNIKNSPGIFDLMFRKFHAVALAKALTEANTHAAWRDDNMTALREATSTLQGNVAELKGSMTNLAQQNTQIQGQNEGLNQTLLNIQTQNGELTNRLDQTLADAAAERRQLNETILNLTQRIEQSLDSSRISVMTNGHHPHLMIFQGGKQVAIGKNKLKASLTTELYNCIEQICNLIQEHQQHNPSLQTLLKNILMAHNQEVQLEEEGTVEKLIEQWLSSQTDDIPQGIVNALDPYKTLPKNNVTDSENYYKAISILYSYGSFFPQDPLSSVEFNNLRPSKQSRGFNI